MFPNLVDDESDSSSSGASRSPSVEKVAPPPKAPPMPTMQGPPKPNQRPIAKVINFSEVEKKNPELVAEPQPETSYDSVGVLGPGQNTGHGPVTPAAKRPGVNAIGAPLPPHHPDADTQDANVFYFRFLIVPKYCGAIIGRAGANINQLSVQTGIHVQINNYTSPMGIEVAPSQLLREVICTGGAPNVRMGILEMYKLLLNDAQELQVKVLISNDQVPTIMGPNGHMMVKLREMAGCKIRLLSDDESVFYSPDRILLLEGPTLMCGNACAMIVELLADMKAMPLPDPDPQKNDNIRGTKRQKPAAAMPAAAIPPSGPLPVTTDVASHMPNIATTTIGLNKTQASMIIGRGGCTINQVRQMTNAKVIVEERPDGNRDLILSGPLDQVEAGLNLVRQVFMTESYDDEKPQQAAQSSFDASPAAPDMSQFALPGMPPMGMPGAMAAMAGMGGGMGHSPFGWNGMGGQDFGYGPVGQ